MNISFKLYELKFEMTGQLKLNSNSTCSVGRVLSNLFFHHFEFFFFSSTSTNICKECQVSNIAARQLLAWAAMTEY